MQLAFGFRFNDLYERAGMLRIDTAFLAFLGEADGALRDKLTTARANPPSGREESDLLVALAPHVEDFLAKLFDIEDEARGTTSLPLSTPSSACSCNAARCTRSSKRMRSPTRSPSPPSSISRARSASG
jgi:hypothetical protein